MTTREHTWQWPNAATRAAQPVTAEQVGDVGLQIDLELEYELIDESCGKGRWLPSAKQVEDR